MVTKNKKGWLRIVEALVSVLIVFGAVLTVATTSRPISGQDFCESLPPLLEEIAQDSVMRAEIIQGTDTRVKKFLGSHILNPSIEYRVKICDPSEPCTHDESGFANVEVCAEERIVASASQGQQVVIQKLKVFLFKRQ